MIANISSAAVGASVPIAFMTMSPRPRPAPAKSPKTVGTMIRASIGDIRLVMIITMKTTTIAYPRMTSIRTPSSVSGSPGTLRPGREARRASARWRTIAH